jgi:hypothetical protein
MTNLLVLSTKLGLSQNPQEQANSSQNCYCLKFLSFCFIKASKSYYPKKFRKIFLSGCRTEKFANRTQMQQKSPGEQGKNPGIVLNV